MDPFPKNKLGKHSEKINARKNYVRSRKKDEKTFFKNPLKCQSIALPRNHDEFFMFFR